MWPVNFIFIRRRLPKNSLKAPAGQSLPQNSGPNHSELTASSRQKKSEIGLEYCHSPVTMLASGMRAQGTCIELKLVSAKKVLASWLNSMKGS